MTFFTRHTAWSNGKRALEPYWNRAQRAKPGGLVKGSLRRRRTSLAYFENYDAQKESIEGET